MKTPRERQRWLCQLFLLVLALGVGCASGPSPSLRAPAAAGHLRILVHGDSEVEEQSLSTALEEAGYRVVRGEQQGDLGIFVRLGKAGGRCIGVPSLSNANDYDTTIELVDFDGVVFACAQYRFADEGIRPESFADFIQELGHSQVLHRALRVKERRQSEIQQEKRRLAAEARKKDELRAQSEARAKLEYQQREEQAWAKAEADKCKDPQTASDCDQLTAFFRDYPDGAHSLDAKTVLLIAEPKLERIRDETAWTQSNYQSCQAPQSEDACDRVKQYLSIYPAGQHSAEAARLVALGVPLIEKLQQARDHADEQAQRQAAKPSSQGGHSHRAAPPKSDGGGSVKCCDGTLSPSCICGGRLRGCCSHHGGVCGCE